MDVQLHIAYSPFMGSLPTLRIQSLLLMEPIPLRRSYYPLTPRSSPEKRSRNILILKDKSQTLKNETLNTLHSILTSRL